MRLHRESIQNPTCQKRRVWVQNSIDLVPAWWSVLERAAERWAKLWWSSEAHWACSDDLAEAGGKAEELRYHQGVQEARQCLPEADRHLSFTQARGLSIVSVESAWEKDWPNQRQSRVCVPSDEWACHRPPLARQARRSTYLLQEGVALYEA